MDDLEIRPALDEEARACRMLLPAMFPADQAPDLLVAWSGRTFAGALGLGTVPLPDGAGVVMDLHVVPPCRRRGIGRALIQAAARRCQRRAAALRTLRPVPSDSPAAALLRACAFQVQERVLHYETDTAAFLAEMTRRRSHLEQRGRIPPAVSVVPLRDAPADQVAALVSTHFPAQPDDILRRLQPAAPNALDIDNSVALLLDHQVRAALIFDWKDGLPMIQVRVVDPALRGGWANVLILQAATSNGFAAGAARFRFFAAEGVADTMKLATRAGATLVGTDLQMILPLG